MEARWTWAAASVRGTSHERAGLRVQDAHACVVSPDSKPVLVATVCDGAGSSSHGGQGASLVCRTFTRSILNGLGKDGALPSDGDLEAWLDRSRDQIGAVAAKRGLLPRDFASTLVSVISSGVATVISHIGDGCAVLRSREDGQWLAPSWPEHGEYASTTYFVTDEIDVRLRITRLDQQIDALAVFSDGIERLVLDMQGQRPSARYFESVIAPVIASPSVGKDPALCAQLKSYLNSLAINSRTDDDKSLLLAALK